MSFRVKFHHAVRQMRSLEADMDAWVATSPYTVAQHVEAKTGEHVYTAMLREEPDPRWSVRIGECLYGFRSALDHLAFELAEKFTTPMRPAVEEGSEFPIFGTRPPNVGEITKKIGGVHPDAQAIIKALQPHNRGDPAYLRDPLWILDKLGNIDKHRSLHLIVPAKRGIEIKVTKGSIGPTTYASGPVHDGAEVLRFVPIPDVDGHMDVQFKLSYFVSFSEGPPAFGEPVIATLVAIAQRIGNDVFSPLATFLR